MAKFLIGTLDGRVRSAHNPPLVFSVSGRYVVDVPGDVQVAAATDSLPELLYEKVVGIRGRPAVRDLTFSLSDELLAVPNVDAARSSSFFLGPNKRTAMLPGGTLVTNPLPIAAPTSNFYLHWCGFTLWSDQGPEPPDAVPPRPVPPRLLYNYDPVAKSFVEFDPSGLVVEVWNSAFSLMLLAADFETVQAFSFGPGSVRLKFRNQTTSTVYLSDWLVLHD
jgi:hypothetical protein